MNNRIRRIPAFAAAVLALSLFLYGCMFYRHSQSLSGGVYHILAAYGKQYPMPEEERARLDRLIGGIPFPQTISRVDISYWGPVPDSADSCMQRVAYSYDTGHAPVGVFALHEGDQPHWYLEIYEYREAFDILCGFAAASVTLLFAAAGFWLLAERRPGMEN